MLMLARRRGVTLIELSITIAVAAILIALAVPSFQIMLANAQIRTAAQALHDGLQLARTEAIRRNGRVIFTKGSQSAWTVSVESNASVVQARPSSEGSTVASVAVSPNGATRLTFTSLGRVVAWSRTRTGLPRFPNWMLMCRPAWSRLPIRANCTLPDNISRSLYLPRGWGYLSNVSGAGQLNEAVKADAIAGHYSNLQSLLASETNGATGEL